MDVVMLDKERFRLAIRDAILVRRGERIDDAIAEERSRNMIYILDEAVFEALDASEETTPAGYDVHETAEEHANRVIK